MIDVTEEKVKVETDLDMLGSKFMNILESHASMILEEIRHSEERVTAAYRAEIQRLKADIEGKV